MGLSHLVRAAIFVRDLERSERFYRDVLGLSDTYFEGELRHEAVAKLLGIEPSQLVRAIILKVPGPSFGMVGLFEVAPPPAPVDKRRGTANVGEAVLVFYCANLDHVVERLVAGSHEIVCPPTYLQVTPTRGQREMTFYDPDGIMVNLIERDERLVG